MAGRDLGSQRALAISSFNEAGWERRREGDDVCVPPRNHCFFFEPSPFPLFVLCGPSLVFRLSCLLPSSGRARRNHEGSAWA